MGLLNFIFGVFYLGFIAVIAANIDLILQFSSNEIYLLTPIIIGVSGILGILNFVLSIKHILKKKKNCNTSDEKTI